jgi:hypothetical protein
MNEPQPVELCNKCATYHFVDGACTQTDVSAWNRILTEEELCFIRDNPGITDPLEGKP